MSHSATAPLTTEQISDVVDYLRRAWFGSREYLGIHLALGPGISVEFNHSEEDVVTIDITLFDVSQYTQETPPTTLSGYEGPQNRLAALLEGSISTTFDSTRPVVFEYNPLLGRGNLAVYSAELPLKKYPATNSSELTD